jgi:hypothetical protein
MFATCPLMRTSRAFRYFRPSCCGPPGRCSVNILRHVPVLKPPRAAGPGPTRPLPYAFVPPGELSQLTEPLRGSTELVEGKRHPETRGKIRDEFVVATRREFSTMTLSWQAVVAKTVRDEFICTAR